MPPEILAHFKDKKEGNKNDKDRRKEAVKKARVRIEEQKRGKKDDKEKEIGQKGS